MSHREIENTEDY